MDEKDDKIFVNLPHAEKVSVIERNSSAVVDSWRTDDARLNFPMALDEEESRVFIVCRRPAVLLAFDTKTGAVVAKLPSVGDADDIFYDRKLRRIYVSGGEGAIVVYQQDAASSYKTLARIPTVAGARTSNFSETAGRLYLAVPGHGGQPAEVRIFRTGK